MLVSYKVVILGSMGVGKTCISTMYAEGIFPHTKPTIAGIPKKKKKT